MSDAAQSETATQRHEQVEHLAERLKIPLHEADRLLSNMEYNR